MVSSALVLSYFTLPLLASASSPWVRGSFTTVTWQNSSFSVALNGTAWLEEGGATAQCLGVGRSTFNGTLLASGDPSDCSGEDPRLGPFDCQAQALAPSDGAPGCMLTIAIAYYPARDAFEFTATFPAAGVPGVALRGLPIQRADWPTPGNWPLSTAFPDFGSVRASLGFANTRGNLLSDNFAWARTSFLGSYQGGMEGGPLLLFDAAASSLHPPALVLSPLTHAKSVFVAPRSPGPLPPATSISGTYREVDHGQMAPIVCTTEGQVATFLNNDPRAPSCWVKANCTLVAPSGAAACIHGTYWGPTGAPFGPPWTLTVAADFGSLTTSDGAQWVRACPASATGLAVGVSGLVAELPPSFQQRVLLVGRGEGLAAAWSGWGAAMTAAMPQGGRLTLDRDRYSARLHYMTDNGAIYCYCNNPNGVPMLGTVAQLIQYHRALGVSPALYHLDPFWHSHHATDGHCDGVTASAWTESEFHWAGGGGLASLGVDVQALFMLLAGPLKKTDLPGGNAYDAAWPMLPSDTDTLTWGSYDGIGGNAQVAASHSLDFWLSVFGERVTSSRLRALVLDTLFVWHQGFSSRLNNTVQQEQWLDGLFSAASALALPVRVDQSNPSDHLFSAERGWPALVSARCGLDQDGGGTWTNFGSGTGAFLAALHIRPVMDVLWSVETQPTRNGGTRPHIAHELVLAVLTTGPLGFGDALNFTNATLLRSALGGDGATILKPVAPATRVDAYYGSAQFGGGEVWAAPSVPARGASPAQDTRADSRGRLSGAGGASGDGVWWWSLLATGVDGGTGRGSQLQQLQQLSGALPPSALWPPSAPGTEFLVAEFGAPPCVHGSPAASCLSAWGAQAPFNFSTAGPSAQGEAPRRWRLLSASPVLPSGWSIVGEEARVVRVSPQRILVASPQPVNSAASDAVNASLELSLPGAQLAFGVLGWAGESVQLTLVAPSTMAASSTAAGTVPRAKEALEGQIYLLSVEFPQGAQGQALASVRCKAGAGPAAPTCTVSFLIEVLNKSQ